MHFSGRVPTGDRANCPLQALPSKCYSGRGFPQKVRDRERALASAGRNEWSRNAANLANQESWSFELSPQSYWHLSQCQPLSALPFSLLQQNFSLEGGWENMGTKEKKKKSEKKGEEPERWLGKGKVHFAFTWLLNMRTGSLPESLD